jgi:hypothetical protein
VDEREINIEGLLIFLLKRKIGPETAVLMSKAS